ncbi:uncharacterized protein DUF2778 [Rhodopseudomonas thermotolerans]|uniref:Uncharacterized protein DUF2778 n=2 Tax=Rhodopseudomonas TaxID=1073 RepID=A0A336JQY7_9BRAD|nr:MULTISPECIES: DUF2778 domain-containing protein [Rhodopseudomonas]RED34414.1 uncharacterized protein DUF2778 [Rhodopseudomonas pentothenatexigens]REG02610.1 uncharacterized protein DUF2778 [Rhodopseudomonas thermotolerans]SSW91083.1 uncharacterized protein DUF2778 [Rhodopseudomonas pentothenatexigens]
MTVGTGRRSPSNQRGARYMGFRKSLGAIGIALPVIGCVWTVYANTVGASIYPTVGSWRDDQVSRSSIERTSFSARFEPLAAAAEAAPQLMASLALKSAFKRQETRGVQVASADPTDVPVTSSVQASEPAKTGHRYYALLDPSYSFGFQPDRFKQPAQNPESAAHTDDDAKVGVAPPPSPVKEAMNVPLPPQRAKSIAALTPRNPSRNPYSHEALVARAKSAILMAAQNQKSSFFEKLFGKVDSPALAYASADTSDLDVGQVRDNAFNPSDDDRYTAVYDITAKTVYMPDGSKLEAHSGLGARMDDPRHVNVKMQGATPPHIYDLKMREKLFHGVAAIRLTPVGGQDVIYGRTGLLAHTYMLGPRGDSNGCVSFKDYNAFLQAFKRGEVKRLVVVGSMT